MVPNALIPSYAIVRCVIMYRSNKIGHYPRRLGESTRKSNSVNTSNGIYINIKKYDYSPLTKWQRTTPINRNETALDL